MKYRGPYNPKSNKANTQEVQSRKKESTDGQKRRPVVWADFKFPPINLWIMPLRKDLHDLIMERLMSGGIESMFEDYDYSKLGDSPITTRTLRINVIGQNGNDGLHYGQVQAVKEAEYLDKLIEGHWNYIKQVLDTAGAGSERLIEIGFHYRTAFAHGWKHHAEYMEENK